jgi:hypothetical protein
VHDDPLEALGLEAEERAETLPCRVSFAALVWGSAVGDEVAGAHGVHLAGHRDLVVAEGGLFQQVY